MRALVIIVVVVAAGLGLCCCGGVFLMYFGMSVLEDDIQKQLEANARFVEHIGQIKEMETDLMATGERDDEALVFRVEGTKGRGRVAVLYEPNEAGQNEIVWAELILPDGQTVELVPGE